MGHGHGEFIQMYKDYKDLVTIAAFGFCQSSPSRRLAFANRHHRGVWLLLLHYELHNNMQIIIPRTQYYPAAARAHARISSAHIYIHYVYTYTQTHAHNNQYSIIYFSFWTDFIRFIIINIMTAAVRTHARCIAHIHTLCLHKTPKYTYIMYYTKHTNTRT
jgi:hypothetical protein